MNSEQTNGEHSASRNCSAGVSDEQQKRLDKERREGYKDASEDLATMLSCPVCHALKYLAATEPAPGYMSGWRLAMIEVKHSWQHACPEFYQRTNAEVRDDMKDEDPRVSAIQCGELRTEYHKPDLGLAYSVMAPMVSEAWAFLQAGKLDEAATALCKAKAVIDTAAITSAAVELVADEA